jgi:hypothetical protein
VIGALVLGLLVPAAVAAAAWGAGWRPWSRRAEPVAGGMWSGAVAMAAACVAGALQVAGWTGIPPLLAEGWLPILAVAGGIAGLATGPFPRAAPAARGLLAILAVALVLTRRRDIWSPGEALLWHLPLIAGAFAIHASIDVIAARRPGPAIPATMGIWTAGAAGALALTGSLKYGQLAAVPAAAMAVAAAAAAWKPGFTLGRGAAAVLAPWTAALVVCGYFYSDLPAGAALLLGVSPLALWIGEAALVTRRRPGVAAGVRLGVVTLPVAIALAIAAAAY